jgi:hypothetical protein
MATTSPKLTIPFTVGAGAIIGQGNQPELWCLYTTDDASVSSPVWIDATADVRSFSTSRGRASELSSFDAGTWTVVVDNRDRTFDPTVHAAITPFNRWWLRVQFSGETHDLIKGYAESYDNQWPGGGWSDAVCVVSGSDEFKVLATNNLPVTNPPRGTYGEVVQSDAPDGYWPMNDDPAGLVQTPEPPASGASEAPEPAPQSSTGGFGMDEVFGGIWRRR